MGLALQGRGTRLRITAAPILFLLLFFYYPLWKVIGQVDMDGLQFLQTTYVREQLLGGLQQACWSVLLTLLLAAPLAYWSHAKKTKWTQLQLAIHAAPFVMPVFVVLFGLQTIFGNNGWLHGITGWNLLGAVGPMGAIAIAHAYYNVGFAARLLTASLDARPRSLDDAAAVLGASPKEQWIRVVLPMLASRIGSVALLVFFFSFTSFAVVHFLGAGDIGTFETLLYGELVGAFPNQNNAAALALLQLLLNAALLFAYLRLLPVTTKSERPPKLRKGTGASWILVGLSMLPAFAVLQGSFSWEVWASLLPGHERAPSGFQIWDVLGRTLFYAVTSATLAVGLSLLMAKSKRAVFASLPLGTSSVVLGVGFYFAFGANAPAFLDLRGSRWLIILAHTLVAFPFAFRVLQPAYQSRDKTLEAAARTLGAGRDIFWRVTLPLLRPPLLVATGFSFAMSLGDFGASLLLMNRNNMGLAVWISRLDRPFDAFAHQQALAATSILLLLTIASYVLIERFRKETEF